MNCPLILLTPSKSDTFLLYRESGEVEVVLEITMKEAENLAEELQRHTKGRGEHMRVLIPNIDKPKKITRPVR